MDVAPIMAAEVGEVDGEAHPEVKAGGPGKDRVLEAGCEVRALRVPRQVPVLCRSGEIGWAREVRPGWLTDFPFSSGGLGSLCLDFGEGVNAFSNVFQLDPSSRECKSIQPHRQGETHAAALKSALFQKLKPFLGGPAWRVTQDLSHLASLPKKYRLTQCPGNSTGASCRAAPFKGPGCAPPTGGEGKSLVCRGGGGGRLLVASVRKHHLHF